MQFQFLWKGLSLCLQVCSFQQHTLPGRIVFGSLADFTTHNWLKGGSILHCHDFAFFFQHAWESNRAAPYFAHSDYVEAPHKISDIQQWSIQKP